MTGEVPTIDVRLRWAWITGVGYRYDVILGGEVIVRRSRDPEHDAARALLSRGCRGRFRTVDFVTGRPRMILDIEKAAGLRVVERAEGGITLARYVPLTEDIKASLNPHTFHQGRVIPDGMAPGAREAFEANGGETCADSEGPRAIDGGREGRLLEAAEHEDA